MKHRMPVFDGDGHVLELLNSTGVHETVSLGDFGDADYSVEAWLYCEYRPEVAHDGFDRVGIFARDDGNVNVVAEAVDALAVHMGTEPRTPPEQSPFRFLKELRRHPPGPKHWA